MDYGDAIMTSLTHKVREQAILDSREKYRREQSDGPLEGAIAGEVRQYAVNEAVQRLRIGCSEVTKLANLLQDRLGPILSPELKQVEADAAAVPEVCSFAEEIESINRDVTAAGKLLQSIVQRLEVDF
jgi:hypothetical protein